MVEANISQEFRLKNIAKKKISLEEINENELMSNKTKRFIRL